MTPEPITVEEWCAALAREQPWEVAYPVVHQCAIAWLQAQSVAQDFTTAELVDGLFPAKQARTDAAVAARKRLYTALLIEPKVPLEIDQYRKRGEPRVQYVRGRKVNARPWVWRNKGG